MSWRASSHAKYDCKNHLIWCPKRRRPLEDADVRAFVTDTFQAIAEEFDFQIEELAIEEDHIQVFLEFPPKYSVARVVGILKNISASRTFRQQATGVDSGRLFSKSFAPAANPPPLQPIALYSPPTSVSA
jgi:putative transposase